MSMSDPIADMLTAIRNGQMARLISVDSPSSRVRRGLLDVLKKEGFIEDYEEKEVRKGIKRLSIRLKYFEGKPVIKLISRVSRPGIRTYASVGKMPKIKNGLGISILSTSKGIMTDHDARAANVGGEVLCSVF